MTLESAKRAARRNARRDGKPWVVVSHDGLGTLRWEPIPAKLARPGEHVIAVDAGFRVRVTESRLVAWRRQWPCSTLRAGTAHFDARGDLVGLSGGLYAGDCDGREFDAFIDDHQPRALAKVRGTRCQ